MKKVFGLRPGAWVAIAVGLAAALAGAYSAVASDRLTVERAGAPDGPAVVFVPGLGTPSEVFEPFAAALQDADAHLVTLAGFGGAPAPEALDPFLGPAADALVEHLNAAGVSDAVLVGHSLGGQVALMAAGRAPDRVAHVLLIDSAPFFAGLMQPGADPAAVTARRDAMAAQMAAMPREAFLAMIRQGLPIQAQAPEHQARVMGWVEASDQRAVAVASAEIFAGDLRSHLDAVRAPVTLVYPQTPGFDPAEIARRYAAQYERLERFDMRPVADSRHFVMLDQPERFAEELERVLNGASR